ncbi:MAG: GAF domain-containing protein [Phototrophicaceae bacterium]
MSAANTTQARPLLPSLSSASDFALFAGQVTSSAVVLVSAVVCLVYLIVGIQWQGRTFLGVSTSYTLVVDGSTSLSGTEWAGHAAGVQRLDRLTQLEHVQLDASGAVSAVLASTSLNLNNDYRAARNALRDALTTMQAGDVVRLSFDRTRPIGPSTARTAVTCAPLRGGVAPCSVVYTLEAYPTTDTIAYFAFPFGATVVALAVAVTLIFLRATQPSAQLVAVFCATLAVFIAGIYNNGTTHVWMPMWIIFTVIGAAVAYILVFVFPSRSSLAFRFPVVLGVPVVLASGLLIYDLQLYFNPATPYAFSVVWQLPVGAAFSAFITLFVVFGLRRRNITSAAQRDQINTAILGFGLAVIPSFLWLFSTLAILSGNSIPSPFTSATILPFFVAIPISMAYAVLEYRSGTSDRLLSQGVTYSLMLFALVIGYALVVFGANLIAVELLQASPILPTNPFLLGTVIFLLAVAFLPFRTRLQNRIDQLYYRERREYQNLAEQFARDLSTERTFGKIIGLYIDQVKRTLNARSVFIFLPDEEGGEFAAHAASDPKTDVSFLANSDFIALLKRTEAPIVIDTDFRWERELIPEKARLGLLKANILVPLRASRSKLNGFVVIGAPWSNRPNYRFEEIRFVNSITTQMGVAVERSQVVESLERRVRELDVLSQVSQAVNYSVQYDELLELISTQTTRLIESTHFSISLKDPATTQMFYAFFLEYGERVRENENRRWIMGNDIHSRIIESGQAVRVDDYPYAVEQERFNLRLVDPDISAWMGVPLIAGTTKLGVMAIGTSRAGYTYTDEMRRVFRDIGALAATSIDKARLFTETTLRARQLRALNDISRQLQSERNVDKLIQRITSSAVEILNAEAGSLLLTTEDDSKDLEFRVVVGGGGSDLLGRRIQNGQGLVGRVAKSGNHEIVNNTEEDARWQGEVTESKDFRTRALLAVPLLAGNAVIGVLEVLNKKDGSYFVEEDADLLITFAGQAAIALDNARLFQMTDKQLEQRVQELETLEKIDTELNRTLRMEEVAATTVKWAVVSSGANAALLGLIIEDNPPVLRVLHSYGYTEKDLPAGVDAERKMWPLDRGIVKRVMRTHQADVQPETKIDPEYVPSLRNATSQITVPIFVGGEMIGMLILEKNTNPRLGLLDLAFVQRITDHAAIAIENARLYTALENAAANQSKFMGIGAHELKNTLTPIKGYAELLPMLGVLTPQQQDFLGVIRSNASRMQLIIDDLRDFAKLRARELRVEPEPIHLSLVVTETLRSFVGEIDRKQQTLVNNITMSLPRIMGDSPRLIQIMTNFISNANKYSPEGAIITLDAKVLPKYVNQRGERIGDALQISVADNGIGISKEDLKNLFQEYFRSTNKEALDQPGTGLGMYLTRALIHQHGGDVWVESELGMGTTFFFTVPLVVEDAPEPASD